MKRKGLEREKYHTSSATSQVDFYLNASVFPFPNCLCLESTSKLWLFLCNLRRSDSEGRSHVIFLSVSVFESNF